MAGIGWNSQALNKLFRFYLKKFTTKTNKNVHANFVSCVWYIFIFQVSNCIHYITSCHCYYCSLFTISHHWSRLWLWWPHSVSSTTTTWAWGDELRNVCFCTIVFFLSTYDGEDLRSCWLPQSSSPRFLFLLLHYHNIVIDFSLSIVMCHVSVFNLLVDPWVRCVDQHMGLRSTWFPII